METSCFACPPHGGFAIFDPYDHHRQTTKFAGGPFGRASVPIMGYPRPAQGLEFTRSGHGFRPHTDDAFLAFFGVLNPDTPSTSIPPRRNACHACVLRSR